ncbi:MAG: hypothetical protein K0U29_05705, partial [Gammaproteobacteria bacterium]|nr:hypothetical protein [Gammaproteobacteria bacterium]
VESILEKELALAKLGRTLGIGQGRSNKTTNAFFTEQVRNEKSCQIGLHAADDVFGKIRIRYSGSRQKIVYQHDQLTLGGDESINADVTRFLLVCLGSENEARKSNQDKCLDVIREIRKSCPEIYCQFLAVFRV